MKISLYLSPKSLHWYHWVVLVFSLALTITAWQITYQQALIKSQVRFNYQVEQVLALIQERMSKYEEALWAGVSALTMFPGHASRRDWATFSNQFNVESHSPGINGIGVIHYVPETKLKKYLEWQRKLMADYTIHPARNGKEYWPITYIEPVQENKLAIGLDMAHEANRYTAALRSKNLKKPSITGPIILVQDSQKKPGFLFYVPWYAKEQVPDIFGQDSSGFLGLVYAPFVVDRLMNGTLDKTNRMVNFSIFDGETELYNDFHSQKSNSDAQPLLSKKFQLDMYGRIWTFDFHSSLLFREQQKSAQSTLILLFGILVDILLLIIFVMLNQEKKRARIYAKKVTKDLQNRTDSLEKVKSELELHNKALKEANHELDQFAYVASHDLKAPLRGIAQLVSWITEDLSEHLTPTSEQYTVLLHNRVSRLERLLDDLLLYSRLGRKHGNFRLFHIEPKVKEMCELLSSDKSLELRCDDNVGEFMTLTTPLELILRNLIGNAFKHHDKKNGFIHVIAEDLGDHYRFTVEDNGPGIPEKYREKVFELFHTLHPRDSVEGSGLGLSIIKKTLELYGCQYRIDTNEYQGCTFCFNWPKQRQLEEFSHE